MFSIRYRFLFMILLGGYSFLNTLLVESFEHYPIVTPKPVIFLLFLVLTITIWEGNRLLDNFLATLEIRSFWKRISYSFGASILAVFFTTMLLGGITSYYTISQNWMDWILPMKLLLMFSFRVNLFLNTINVIFLYHQQLEKSNQEVENYKRISSQAQLQALKNQVNPHFLFNNLSVLSALIPMDANASVEFVRQFSRVYRYVLKSPEKEIIELKEELNFIESYLYLLKTRFESGLVFTINVDKDCQSAFIVPVSLQMLVENAVKHNVIGKNKPLHVEILCLDNETITVRNNLQLKQADDQESTGLGLNNITQRYEFLGQHGLEVKQTSEQFSVTIPLIRPTHASFFEP